MIKTFTIETGQKLTEEQLAEINEAKKYPIVFDDDCPELSPAIIKDTVHFLCHRTMLLLFFHS